MYVCNGPFSLFSDFIEKDLCIREMVVRAAKHILRSILFETESSYLAPAVSHFLNCLFGTPTKRTTSSQTKKKKKKKQITKVYPKYLLLFTHLNFQKIKGTVFQQTHETLWNQLKKSVSDRFQYEIKEEERQNINVIPTLRNFCQKMGIKLSAKEYDFSLSEPFQIEDILDLYPVVKHTGPKVKNFLRNFIIEFLDSRWT